MSELTKLLQCEECAKDLEEFKKTFKVRDEEVLIAVEMFAVFIEMRRMRRTTNPPAIPFGTRLDQTKHSQNDHVQLLRTTITC